MDFNKALKLIYADKILIVLYLLFVAILCHSEENIDKPINPPIMPKLQWAFDLSKYGHTNSPLMVLGNKIILEQSNTKGQGAKGTTLLCISLGNGKLVWEKTFEYGNYVFVSSEDDKIYAADRKGSLLLVSPKTGKTMVKKRFVKEMKIHPLAVDDDIFYFKSEKGLSAANILTGKAIWENKLQPFRIENAGDDVILAELEGITEIDKNLAGIYGVDKKNGEILWNYTVSPEDNLQTDYGNGINWYKTENDKTVIVAGITLTIIDTKTGKILYSQKKNDEIPCLFQNDILFYQQFAWDERKIYLVALDLGDKKVLWKHDVSEYGPQSASRSVILSDHHVFYNASGMALECLSLLNGELLWKLPMKEEILEKPFVENGYILFIESGTNFELRCFKIPSETSK